MAVEPEEIDSIAAMTAGEHEEAELDLVRLVARHLEGKIDSDLDDQQWVQEKLGTIDKLKKAVQSIVSGLLTKTAASLDGATEDAFRSGWASAADEIPMQRTRKPAVPAPGESLTSVQLLSQAINKDVGNRVSNILRDTVDAYRTVITAATTRTLAGSLTRRQASQAAWQDLTDRGLAGFTDRSGRRWRLSSYVEMAVRTVAQRAAIQGQTERLASLGVDLVMVSNSAQECKLCRPFEGRVLSLDGPTGRVEVPHVTDDSKTVVVTVVDTLDGARRKGFQHPNCRHSVSAYLPGVSTLPERPTADPEGDNARQQQRALERRIRREKTREAGALSETDRKVAKTKVKAAQARLVEHLDTNPNLKRLRYREQIGAGNIPPQPKKPVTPKSTPMSKSIPKPVSISQPKVSKATSKLATGKGTPKQRDQWATEREHAATGMRAAKRFDSNSDGIAWANEHMPLPGLTDVERDVVNRYTGVDHGKLNRRLRKQLAIGPDAQAEFDALVSDLDSAIGKASTPEALIVHRGTDYGFANALGADLSSPETVFGLVGKVFTEPGYMSTSVGSNAAFGGQVNLMIRVPKDYQALNAMSISRFGDKEREILLRRDSRYVVHAAYQHENRWYIEAEIVPDDWAPGVEWTPSPYGDAWKGYQSS